MSPLNRTQLGCYAAGQRVFNCPALPTYKHLIPIVIPLFATRGVPIASGGKFVIL